MKTKTPAAMGTGVFVEAMKIRLYYGYRLGNGMLNLLGAHVSEVRCTAHDLQLWIQEGAPSVALARLTE
jgi:hypothetical protein